MVFVPNPGDLGDVFLSPRLLAERAISERAQEFTAVIGQPVSELIESIESGFVQRYEFGSMYWRNREIGAKCVHGAIYQHYQTLGSEGSWLGYPVTDEIDFTEGGRVSSFERGAIYWWSDTGAIELNDLVVNYTGIVCFGETDELSASDEPYVTLGMISPIGTSEAQSRIYEGVDAGESRTDLIEIYRGKPLGLTITVLLMEHDEGDPNKYKEIVQGAVAGAFAGVTALTALIPGVGPAIAAAVGPVLGAVTPKGAEFLNDLADFGDNKINETTLAITPKQMVVLAARTVNSEERGVGFKLATPLLSGLGASYKVYFGFAPA